MRSASITISMDINNNKNSNQRENARSHRPVSQLFPDPGLPDGLFEVMHAWPGAGAERLFNQNSNCIQSSNQYGTRRNLNRKHLFRYLALFAKCSSTAKTWRPCARYDVYIDHVKNIITGRIISF